MRFSFVLYTIVFASILCSCKKETEPKTVKQVEIKFKHEGNLQFLDSLNSPKQEIQIEIADNDFERQTGLMYRKKMASNRGMLFIFDDNTIRSFYMKNTYIPLDLVFIDQNNTIVSIAKNAKPLDESSVRSEGNAQYVLEINAGLSEQWKLKKGDKVNFSKL